MPLFNRESCQLGRRYAQIIGPYPLRHADIGRRAFIDPPPVDRHRDREILKSGYGVFKRRMDARPYAATPPETLNGFVREYLDAFDPLEWLLGYFPDGEVDCSGFRHVISETPPLAGLSDCLVFVDYSIDEEGYIPHEYYIEGYEPDHVAPVIHADRSDLYEWHGGYKDLIGPISGTDLSQPTYGVEIECYCGDGNEDIAHKAHEFEQTFAATDGSLHEDFGAEVITGYTNLRPMLKHLAPLTNALTSYNVEAPQGEDEAGNVYGLHVHRSRGDLNNYHLTRMFNLMRNMHTNDYLQFIAGRGCGEYQYMVDTDDVTNVMRTGSPTDRYRVINTTSYTVEFRMFHSTLNMERLTYRLEFVDAVCAFVKTCCGLKPTTWGFLSYLHRNKDRWPALVAKTNERAKFTPKYGRVLYAHHHSTPSLPHGAFSIAA